MAASAATVLIENIRENLNDKVIASSLTDPIGGRIWRNSTILTHLNYAKNRLWDIIRRTKEDYFLKTGDTSITLLQGVKEYTLPTDFWQIRGLKITTSNYEYTRLRGVKINERDFKERDAEPFAGTDPGKMGELLFAIVGTGILKLSNYPPSTLQTSMDYIKKLPDYTLAVDSVSEIPDVWEEYLEAYTTRRALFRDPADTRIALWDKELMRLEPMVMQSVDSRQDRDPQFVVPYDPWS